MLKAMIYGVGECGRYVFEEIEKHKNPQVCIEGWIDNFTKENRIENLPVMREEVFIKNEKTVDAVLIAIKNPADIQKVIISLLNHEYRNIYVVDGGFFRGRLPVLGTDGKLSMYVKAYDKILPVLPAVQYPVTYHCNLNCRGCGSFSNISKEGYVSNQEFERDVKALRRKFKNLGRFTFYGGEALLNPNLAELIRIVKEVYPMTSIAVFSNGLAITGISGELKAAIQDTGAHFVITQYPPTQRKLPQIVSFLESNQMDYKLEPPVEHFYAVLAKTEQDYKKAFYKRCIIHRCRTIKDGRLYQCPLIPFMVENQEYLGVESKEEELYSCSLDLLNGLENAWEILARLERPFTLCRYCALGDEIEIPWQLGKAEKDDWLGRERNE